MKLFSRILISLLLLTAACAPFEEGVVIDTWYTEPRTEIQCGSSYDAWTEQWRYQCSPVFHQGYWTVELAGYDADGLPDTHSIQLRRGPNAPQPVYEGDVYSLAENRVVERQ